MIYALTAYAFNNVSTRMVYLVGYFMLGWIIHCSACNTSMTYRDLPKRFDGDYYETLVATQQAKVLLHLLLKAQKSKTNKKKYVTYKKKYLNFGAYEQKCLKFVKKHLVPYSTTQLTFPIYFSNKHGNTALHYAAWLNFCDLTKFLLQCGAAWDLINFNFKTPLALAENKDTEKIIKQHSAQEENDLTSHTSTEKLDETSDREDQEKFDQA